MKALFKTVLVNMFLILLQCVSVCAEGNFQLNAPRIPHLDSSTAVGYAPFIQDEKSNFAIPENLSQSKDTIKALTLKNRSIPVKSAQELIQKDLVDRQRASRFLRRQV